MAEYILGSWRPGPGDLNRPPGANFCASHFPCTPQISTFKPWWPCIEPSWDLAELELYQSQSSTTFSWFTTAVKISQDFITITFAYHFTAFVDSSHVGVPTTSSRAAGSHGQGQSIPTDYRDCVRLHGHRFRLCLSEILLEDQVRWSGRHGGLLHCHLDGRYFYACYW